MKNSKNVIYKALIALCLLIFLAIILYVLIHFSIINTKSEAKTENTVTQIQVDNMTFLRPFELRSENYLLSQDLMIKDENGTSLSFKDLVDRRGAVLIYRFSEMHCDLCIKQHIDILNNLMSKRSLENIVLLSAYTNTKKIKILKQTYHLDFQTFNIMDDIGIPLEKVSNPYFFIVDKDLTCHCFVAATKEHPELTISCLDAMMDNLQTDYLPTP